ncbi:phospholipid carrier-dependent glycosyltransferase [Nocardioides sp. CER19]|uniref:dolichyl-phosphate-mannose--protein mannosyltransferase n=1 Tax=Nocardioides sp. CER19 TaxID=3038538 RepID=UPI00244CA0B9|nr:phospholipid carrier-dependent glycosyltransferase [Nocardioides sp. CER19]MDH2414686.1 phospholipid carrier-dependent glycosyltransferase [Nocardioides sp. CER19]
MTVIDEQPVASLSRTASGAEVPTAWERARALLRLRDPLVGWVATVLVTVLAFVMRLWHLGTPREFQFDETYYAKDAWSLLHFGYARNYADNANEQILGGHTTGSFQSSPEMVVHPEVGKWLIALGEKAFGMDPFGWRISSAVVGALMILVMIRLARRMTGSTLIGVVAGLLLSFDGLQFVLSRLALLDIFVAFFTLCAVSCAVADRDWFRERLARRLEGPATGWGPRVLWRPWLLASGLFWGLAVGTKWTAMYPLAAFGVLVFVWSAGARRSFGVRMPLLKGALADGVPAFVHLVVVAALVYTVSWTGWLMHAHTYEQALSSTQYTTYAGQGHCEKTTYVADNPDTDKRWPTATEPDAHGLGEVEQSLRSLWYYHQDVWTFHTHFLNCATHVYASSPAGWLLLNRPVGVAATTDIKPGDQGCTAPQGSDCIKQVILLGTPMLWWGGVVALLYAVAMWLGGRDWRFGVAVVGVASTWLPWFLYDDRPIFSYYAIVTLPFLVLALALAIGKLIGREREPSPRRTAGVVLSGAYLVLVILNFAWFWPIYTNALLTHASWLDRIWFQRWI